MANIYRWSDLAEPKEKEEPTAPVAPAPGWAEPSDRGNDSLGTPPSGPGIDPKTAGMLGLGAQTIGAVTGNSELSMAGGLLGMAGSRNPAASFAGATTGLAVGGKFGGPVGSAVTGAINDGPPGAAAGFITGAAMKALGPFGFAVAALDQALNEGKGLAAISNTISDVTRDIFGPNPMGTSAANRASSKDLDMPPADPNYAGAAAPAANPMSKDPAQMAADKASDTGSPNTATGSGWGGSMDMGGNTDPGPGGNPGDW